MCPGVVFFFFFDKGNEFAVQFASVKHDLLLSKVQRRVSVGRWYTVKPWFKRMSKIPRQ